MPASSLLKSTQGVLPSPHLLFDLHLCESLAATDTLRGDMWSTAAGEEELKGGGVLLPSRQNDPPVSARLRAGSEQVHLSQSVGERPSEGERPGTSWARLPFGLGSHVNHNDYACFLSITLSSQRWKGERGPGAGYFVRGRGGMDDFDVPTANNQFGSPFQHALFYTRFVRVSQASATKWDGGCGLCDASRAFKLQVQAGECCFFSNGPAAIKTNHAPHSVTHPSTRKNLPAASNSQINPGCGPPSYNAPRRMHATGYRSEEWLKSSQTFNENYVTALPGCSHGGGHLGLCGTQIENPTQKQARVNSLSYYILNCNSQVLLSQEVSTAENINRTSQKRLPCPEVRFMHVEHKNKSQALARIANNMPSVSLEQRYPSAWERKDELVARTGLAQERNRNETKTFEK
ncbi:hypothetical protein K474DRAFT_1676120 [Panus rudis PR-1116 ss-1]|nr:hypothetical protein K474DRAFT_1676120 [Panus rudis PR-1116 ss-1]